MSVPVPFFNIDRIYKRYGADLMVCVQAVFTHGKVLMGPEVDAFEAVIAKRCGRRYAVAVGSCTDALFFALQAAGVKTGDEILVTGFSFIASVSAIIRAGGVPVFVDIDADDFMMSLQDAEGKVTPRTKAMVAVYLFGQSLPVDKWDQFARKHNLVVIEDAAQSFGGSYKGIPVGKMGLASCISFDPTKVIGAFGNGGVLLTDDERVCELAKKLRYHGKDPKTGDFVMLGYNSRLASLQAALLIRQLEWLDEWVSRRQEIASMYTQGLKDIREIQIPVVRSDTGHIFHKYVLKASRRDALNQHLASRSIQTMVHYSKALYEQPVCGHNGKIVPLPAIEEVKGKVLSLPIYPELEQREIDHVIFSVREFYR